VSLAELVGTDDNSKEANLIKKEITEIEKGITNFSAKNFDKAFTIFHKLYDETIHQPRSKGYKYMADYTKELITNGVPQKWDGSFEILIK